MGEVHAGYDQHTGSFPQHGRGDAGAGVQFMALQAPSDGYWHVSS